MILVVPSARLRRDLTLDVDFDPRRRPPCGPVTRDPFAARRDRAAWPSASSPSCFWNAITAANVAFE
jgi:hypothetical protein